MLAYRDAVQLAVESFLKRSLCGCQSRLTAFNGVLACKRTVVAITVGVAFIVAVGAAVAFAEEHLQS